MRSYLWTAGLVLSLGSVVAPARASKVLAIKKVNKKQSSADKFIDCMTCVDGTKFRKEYEPWLKKRLLDGELSIARKSKDEIILLFKPKDKSDEESNVRILIGGPGDMNGIPYEKLTRKDWSMLRGWTMARRAMKMDKKALK